MRPNDRLDYLEYYALLWVLLFVIGFTFIMVYNSCEAPVDNEETISTNAETVQLDKTRIYREINRDTQYFYIRMGIKTGDRDAVRFLGRLVAETYNLDHELLYRLWWLESRFQWDAVSHRNAIGLGQVLLGSARWHWHEAITTEDLFDPIVNGFISGKILRDYIDMSGSVKEALLYYHAGPGRIRAIRAMGQTPFNKWYAEKLI